MKKIITKMASALLATVVSTQAMDEKSDSILPFEKLPVTIADLILLNLNERDISRLSCTSKGINELIAKRDNKKFNSIIQYLKEADKYQPEILKNLIISTFGREAASFKTYVKFGGIIITDTNGEKLWFESKLLTNLKLQKKVMQLISECKKNEWHTGILVLYNLFPEIGSRYFIGRDHMENNPPTQIVNHLQLTSNYALFCKTVNKLNKAIKAGCIQEDDSEDDYDLQFMSFDDPVKEKLQGMDYLKVICSVGNINLLIQNEVYLNDSCTGRICLQIAAQYHHTDLVKFILEKGAWLSKRKLPAVISHVPHVLPQFLPIELNFFLDGRGEEKEITQLIIEANLQNRQSATNNLLRTIVEKSKEKRTESTEQNKELDWERAHFMVDLYLKSRNVMKESGPFLVRCILCLNSVIFSHIKNLSNEIIDLQEEIEDAILLISQVIDWENRNGQFAQAKFIHQFFTTAPAEMRSSLHSLLMRCIKFGMSSPANIYLSTVLINAQNDIKLIDEAIDSVLKVKEKLKESKSRLEKMEKIEILLLGRKNYLETMAEICPISIFESNF